MSKPALTEVRKDDAELAAEAHERRIAAGLSAQHQERDGEELRTP